MHGTHYHFVSRQAFEEEIRAGTMLEHADVFGNFYGTSRRVVEERLAAGNDVILEIDWQGAQQARTQLSTSTSIMVLPPSLAALESRLRSRGQDDDATITRRLGQAHTEMSHFGEFEYVVVNDDFDLAVRQLQDIISAERSKCDTVRIQYSKLLDELLTSS